VIGLEAGTIALLGYLGMRVSSARIRAVLWPPKRAVLHIIPPSEVNYSPEAWAGFFRNLLAITPPAWKRLIVGIPWVTLEYCYTEAGLNAFCSCSAETTHLVTAAASAALPGVDVQPEAGIELVLLSPAIARACLRLWREPLHPLGRPRLDAMASVIAAMTAASETVVQIAIAPDPGWESWAQRRLDRLSGYVTRNVLLDVALGAIAEVGSI